MTNQIKHFELGESDSTKETILGIQYDEKRLQSLNKVMSKLTAFVNKSQHGLMANKKQSGQKVP